MVFKLSLAAVAATFALSVVAMPTSLHSLTTSLFPRGGEGEPFECPDPSSTAAAKQALIDYGAQSVGKSSPNVSQCDYPGLNISLCRHRHRHVGKWMCLPRRLPRRQQQARRRGGAWGVPQQLAYDPRVL